MTASAESPRRRRRRGRRQGPAVAREPLGAPVTSAPPPPADEAAREAAPQGLAGEEAWERTHLEQTMFELARTHAALAEDCARRPGPDRHEERTHALVAILMSYFALEAFISMVGTDRLGSRYRYYDRMTPEGKWIEVTRLATKTGKTFGDSDAEMLALSSLRSWRNMLTHYKGEYEEVERSDRGHETRTDAVLSAANAGRAVETARAMYRKFYEFDRRSAPRQLIWLDDRPHRRATPPRERPDDGASRASPGSSSGRRRPEPSHRRRRRPDSRHRRRRPPPRGRAPCAGAAGAAGARARPRRSDAGRAGAGSRRAILRAGDTGWPLVLRSSSSRVPPRSAKRWSRSPLPGGRPRKSWRPTRAPCTAGWTSAPRSRRPPTAPRYAIT